MEKVKFPLKERFNGNTVYFKITKDEAKQYKRD
jgi:hypothetical protein